jgi:hypothetical protein
MKVLRVKELADILQDMVNKGYGDRIVLIPETDFSASADYRTICEVTADDSLSKCVYLEINDDEEEQAFWDSMDES